MGTLRLNFPETCLATAWLAAMGRKPEIAHKAKRRLEPVTYANIQCIRNDVARKRATGCQARFVQ